MPTCDPVLGGCLLSDAESSAPARVATRDSGWTVHYVGDPMCSWCWGISPTVKKLEAYCIENGLDFSLVVGGLRSGGGDFWGESFKSFLRHEWTHIHEMTGQPFGFSLLDASFFDYDTEPACRAVVAATALARECGLPRTTPLAFFSAIQQAFYVEGKDPKEMEFYRTICDAVGLDFKRFCQEFTSARALKDVKADFARCRDWGVRSFPSILIEKSGNTRLLAAGYTTPDALIARVEEIRNAL